jgi:hypothetical protein
MQKRKLGKIYAGWPSAVTAVGVAREVFQQK